MRTRRLIMTSPTEDFFAELGRRGRVPMLARATGTIRFELTDAKATQRWLVDIDRGDVRVHRDGEATGDADCVVRTERALFDELAGGHLNAMAGMLRGALTVEGDAELLVLAQRLFPGPPPGDGTRAIATEGRQA
jgi:putative sterol carrier protein